MNKIWNITFCLLFQYLCIFQNKVSTNDITKEDKRNLRHRLGVDNFNIKAENNKIEGKDGKKGSEASEKETKEKNSSNYHESSIDHNDNDNDNLLQSEEPTDSNFGVRDKTNNKKLIESTITNEKTQGKNSYHDDENTIECSHPEALVGGEKNRQNSFALRSNSIVTNKPITSKCGKNSSDDSNHDEIIDHHENLQIISLNAPPSPIFDQKDVSIGVVSEHERPSKLPSDSIQVKKDNRIHLDGHQSNIGSFQLVYEGLHHGNDGVHGATEDRKKARPQKIKGPNQERVERIHELTMDKFEAQKENTVSGDGDKRGKVIYDENDDSLISNSLVPETSYNQDYSLYTINILNGLPDKKSNMKNIDLEKFKDTSIHTKEEGPIVSKIHSVKEEQKDYHKYEKNILHGTKKKSEKVYDLYDYILNWVFGPMKITETNVSEQNDSLELKQRTSWDRTNIISENEEEDDINNVEQLNEIQGEITEDEVEEEKEEIIEEEEYVDEQKMVNKKKIHDLEKINKNEEKNVITKDIETTKYTVTHLEKYNNIKKDVPNFFKTIINLFSDYK